MQAKWQMHKVNNAIIIQKISAYKNKDVALFHKSTILVNLLALKRWIITDQHSIINYPIADFVSTYIQVHNTNGYHL